MHKLFKFLSMLLLVNSNAQDIQMSNNVKDTIVETYKENYVQLATPESVHKIDAFEPTDVITYENMEYRMYSYNLFNQPGDLEDATPYMFPYSDYMI